MRKADGNEGYGILNFKQGYKVTYTTVSIVDSKADTALLHFIKNASEGGGIDVGYLVASGNNITGKGGIFYVDDVEIKPEKGILIEGNTNKTANSYNAAIFIKGQDAKITTDKPIEAYNNKGENGAVFYIDEGIEYV